MDELESLENLDTHQSFIVNAIKETDIREDIFYKIMRTPIICSAADGFIYHFQESATLIISLYGGLEGFRSYTCTL